MASLVYFLLYSLFTLSSSSIPDGLLPNGDFERGPNKKEMKGRVVRGRKAIPEWELSGMVEFIKSGEKQGEMLLVVPEGASAVRLGNEASITHNLVNLTKGLIYAVSLSAARTCAQSERLHLSAAPAHSQSVSIQTLYSSSGWDSYSWAFMALSPTTSLSIHNPGSQDHPDCGPLIDAVAIKALSPPPPPSNRNLLKNGGFEEGPYVMKNTTWGVLVPPKGRGKWWSPVPGWAVESEKAVKFIDREHFWVAEGRRAVELVAGRESVVAQMVRTVVGKRYGMWFSVGDANNTCMGSMLVEAHVSSTPGGAAALKVPYHSTGTGGFKRALLHFVAHSHTSTVSFLSSYYHTRNDDASSLCGPVVDDVRVLSLT